MSKHDPSFYFGMKFGDRIVLPQWKVGDRGNKFFLCRCSKGHEAWVKLAHLNAGSGGVCKTCHCKSIATRHGHAATNAETPVYQKWVNMRARITSDPSYVKRGIKACDRWDVFENFLEDMGEPPDSRMELDRIDGHLGYSKSNCRWVTRRQNNKNRITLRLITFGGMTMCVADWEKYLNLPTEKLRKKLRSKKPLETIMAECGFLHEGNSL